MHIRKNRAASVCGSAAGAINGLFGAGGGMVLVPLLTSVAKLDDEEVFPCSVCIILPICIVSVLLTAPEDTLRWSQLWPYLLGSGLGGIAAGLWGKKIPVVWLHRALGALILWGGFRYLC